VPYRWSKRRPLPHRPRNTKGLENTADVANGRETARNDANESELESVRDVWRHPWTKNWTLSEGEPATPEDIARAAREYPEAGAAGLPCGDLAVALARAVLHTTDVRLALQVLEGGPFAHARATELAGRVLRNQPAAPQAREQRSSED
jgi:hypothetical protein